MTWRCEVTRNPCGTDTWAKGHPCGCGNCQEWIRIYDAGQRSGFSLGTEAAAKVCQPIQSSGGNGCNRICHEEDARRIRALRYNDVKGEKDE